MSESLCALMKKGGGGYKIDIANVKRYFQGYASSTAGTVTSDALPAGKYIAIAESWDITSGQTQIRYATLTTTGTFIEHITSGWDYAIIELAANGTITATGATLSARIRGAALVVIPLK